jgi:hypothetical protein
LVTSSAAAQTSDEPVDVALTFNAPKECATQQAFERRVKARSERIRWVSDAPHSGTARVTLEQTGAAVRVRLAWTRGNDGTTVREFRAPNCEEAMDAAALVIAITFDPTAPTLPPDTSDSQSDQQRNRSAGGTPPGESTSSDPDSNSKAGSGDDSEVQALNIPATDSGALGGGSRSRSSHQIGISATALIEGLSGVAPAPMEGVGLSAGVSWGDGIFVPEVRLVFVHFLGLTYPADGGDAQFELDGGRLVGCPLRLGHERFALRPCLQSFGGRLQASGQNTIEPEKHSRPLWLVGGSLVGTYRPKSVLLFMGDVSLSGPIARDHFQFAPAQFHQVERLVWSAGFGVGLQFP